MLLRQNTMKTTKNSFQRNNNKNTDSLTDTSYKIPKDTLKDKFHQITK